MGRGPRVTIYFSIKSSESVSLTSYHYSPLSYV
nr:MAG TPA: hypothetical protein [Caudoviricetes sp.]